MKEHEPLKVRNSHIELNKVYFWTATIHNWYKLLNENEFKEIIISSLDYLSNLNKIDIFGFVIMPNHIHLIWRMNEMNGKEMPSTSFLKFTAHEFKKKLNMCLKLTDLKPIFEYKLNNYKVMQENKKYEFWQRDSFAFELYTSKVAHQKLDYIHRNPLASHWNLSTAPEDYYYSSASYYNSNKTNFNFLKDIIDIFPTEL